MKVLHFEKNYELRDKELLLIAKKVGKLATYCRRVKDESSSIRVDIEKRNTQKDKDSLKMNITIELPKKTMRAESRKSSVLEAVDRCMEKLEPQVKKYKDMQGFSSKSSAKKGTKRG